MFNAESHMTKPVVQWMKSQHLTVRHEFISPWGVCDLVGLQFNEINVAHRLRLGQKRPIGSMTRAALLLLVPDIETHKSISLRRLVTKCVPFVEPEFVADEMRRLEDDGFVVCKSGELFQKINGWMPLQKRLIAVELKLKRVEEAFSQARNNIGFADESYVALPDDLARRIAAKPNRVQDFEKCGVGLLAVSPHACEIIVRHKPNSSDVNPVAQLYSVEKFWRTSFATKDN